MATYAHTFTSGETVTPTKLNDARTVSNIVNADIAAGAAIADTKLATISTVGKVANSATTATNANTASAIVARDASGNFSAGTITANLSGTATNVTGTVAVANGGTGGNSQSTARAGLGLGNSATLNTGTTSGTVATGDHTHSAATTSAAGFLSTADKIKLDGATSVNTASAIVARDASGNFTAGTITANLTGSAATLATGRTISLTGDVTATTTAFNGSANVSAVATIANNAVNGTKLRDSAALSVIGNATNASADPADITAGTDGHVLRRSGTTLGFGKLTASAFPTNFPIQIVQAVKTDVQTIDTGASDWVNVSGLSLTLTRSIASASGKVRIQAAITCSSNDSNNSPAFRIDRDGTAIGIGAADGSRIQATITGGYGGAYNNESFVIDFIDNSPGSSNTVTYKIQARMYSASIGYVNRSYFDANAGDYSYRTISTLTLTELAP